MNTQKGFTLLELMIVVVVVAILAAIALPNYQSHMIKTRRVAAAACLLEISQWMERSYTVAMTYTGLALPAMQCSGNLAGYYAFNLAVIDARNYSLSATPQGAQANNDPDSCGTLSIDQAGQKTTRGNPDPDGVPTAGGGDVSKCWK